MTIDQIHKILSNNTLPGKVAQYQMASMSRIIDLDKNELQVPSTAKKAAVLLLLYPKHEELHIVFMERGSKYGNDKHKGQISFPGGAFEASDKSYKHTALRESEEEIGIKAKDVNVIGTLTDLYIPVSNYHVFPFVAYIDYCPLFVPEQDEVKRIIEIPLSTFLEKNSKQQTTILLETGQLLKDVPCFKVQNDIIWGATSMMLNEFLQLIQLSTKLL